MKYFFFSFFFFTFYHYSFAQEILIKCTIFSNESHLFIPYATVQIVNKRNTIDANEKGYFEITANKEDSLIISCIGFEKLIMPVNNVQNADSLFLIESFLRLDEVIIKNPTVFTFGIVNEKQGSSRSGGSQAERSEMTTLIEIPKTIESYRISKVFIKGKDFKEENPVRLHIYTVKENGLPGEELLKKEIILSKGENDTKIITIDVKDQNIILEKASFFVGVQWMTSTKVKLFTGPEIIQTYKVSKVLSYYRPCPNIEDCWYISYPNKVLLFLNGKLPAIGTPPSKGNPLNMCASAEIEAFSN